MTASDLGYFAMGAGFVLAIRALIAFFEYKEKVSEAVDGNDMVVHQPEYATHYSEREARRVERPLYEKSTPGFVVRQVDIDSAHMRGARAE